MATRQHRTVSGGKTVTRAAALLTIALAASACAIAPTAPDAPGLQEWNREPITTCVTGGCPVSGARAPSSPVSRD